MRAAETEYGLSRGQRAAVTSLVMLAIWPAACQIPPRDATTATAGTWRPAVDDRPGRTPRLLVRLNQAGPGELCLLPGIGPTLARRILERRDRAAFERVEQLLEVRGIGPSKLAGIRPLVVIDNKEARLGF